MDKKEAKIGGEFEINPELIQSSDTFSFKNPNTLFSSGRSALMAILQKIQNNEKNKSLIYLPYYICSSVVDACKNAKFDVKFYDIDHAFLFPLDFINNIEERASLLSINYFGLVNDNNILKSIKNKRPDIITISDNVQSLWECHKSVADFSFTSLRKHIATPDGAVVYYKGELLKPQGNIEENTFFAYKLKGALSKYNKERDSVYLKYLEEGEKILDNDKTITKASYLGNYVFENTNWESIIEKRKRNYKTINKLGLKYELDFIFPYSKENIPLCVPIRVNNRDEVRRKLMKNNIFLPIHWPINAFNKKSKVAQQMNNKEISLILDQRYSEKEIHHQIICLISHKL